MISHKYGEFDTQQFEDYKTRMRKKIFWLIIYTDEKTNSQYKNVDVATYQENLIREISGLSSILSYPVELVELISMLEAALIELNKEVFNFKVYRKLVLDAGVLMGNLNCESNSQMIVGDTDERI